MYSSNLEGLPVLEREMISAPCVNNALPVASPFAHDRLQEAAANLLTLRTAPDWMRQEQYTKPPLQLFGEFWYENELSILFADTNMGKSVLAVQIANSLTRNEPIEPLRMQTGYRTVLYLDFELSAKQFEQRYTSTGEPYPFSTSFHRAQLNQHEPLPEGINRTQVMLNAITQAVEKVRPSVLIIDNITCLSHTAHATGALTLMEHLKGLKERHQLSILALAHTPKRKTGMAITTNDLQGSKLLLNFCDSAFAIGAGLHGQRYLKQIKQRNTAGVYGANNVCLLQLHKTKDFLQFRFTGNTTEQQLINKPSNTAGNHRAGMAAYLSAQGLSQRKIAAELGVSVGLVNKLLKGG
ncbi:AAA family ATPase [Mucilaginibacter terrae]|uniref:AAA family ATPase n=1 Tax=Mucilaginibacter terrae TaxID=1955052 RepID=UPI00363BEB31